MQAPEAFTDRLDREFRGRLRIRWSHEQSEWHIEQRIKRGLFPGEKPTKKGWDESRDAYVRTRDGYIHVLSIRTGDRMPCPRCRTQLKVPFMRTEVLTCPYCQIRGQRPAIAAMFLPLNDSLIDYLKKIDPENPLSEGLAEQLERQDAALARTMENDVTDIGVQGFSDAYNRIVGIPQIGHTGKEKMWIR